jgi:signal transduction histidine kinase
MVEVAFEDVFNSTSCLFLLLLPDAPTFTIVAASDAYLAATMTRRDAILGRGVFDVFPEAESDADIHAERNVRESFERAASGEPDTMAVQRYAIRRPDGTWETRHWSPHNSPVWIDGRVAYVLHRVEDVTAFVELQGEHEREIVRRGQELAAANEQLRAIATELEAFAYAVSHDLRAPLRVIAGYARLIVEDATLSAETQGHVGRIRVAVSRCEEIVSGLLVLSRVGTQDLRLEPVDLSALARSVAAELREREIERDVECAVADGLTVQADSALMRVLMTNLIGNAMKYSRDRVAARIEIGTADGAFFVADNGIGFDPSTAGKLFSPFVRLHGNEYAGSGVGLATVRRIVHRHGGRVWAESEPGRGAAFRFTLAGGG